MGSEGCREGTDWWIGVEDKRVRKGKKTLERRPVSSMSF